MKLGFVFIVLTAIAVISCGSRENHTKPETEITGAYVKQYSFKVVDTGTGREIGMSTVRDTIFIRSKENGFEVSNNKWRLNDYDREGWRNMEHAEDKPVSTYHAVFNPTDNSLNAEFMPPIHFDQGRHNLFKGKGRDNPYNRVK
jgi:hypothetical protein